MTLLNQKTNNLYRFSFYGIIILGILLRIVVYLQNRCLIIDEANIARNLFERGFMQLTQPLQYEQYAPPLFLWIQKLATVLFGFGEYALRIYPLLCGIAMLPLLYKVLRHYAEDNAIWYGLALAATGFIYLHYSTEVKQYMPDAMVTLALILLALRTPVLTTGNMRFAAIWLLAGSVTIWLSMPGVFTMAAIGAYYIYIIAKEKAWNKLTPLAAVSVLWLAQFAFYYYTILQPQATSDYLQNCHKEYFLFALPKNSTEFLHNWEIVVMKVLGGAAGHWALSIGFHLLCIAIGLVYLLRRHTAKSILIVVPLLLMLLAAALHRYSLIPRLALFAMPLLLVLISVGLGRMFSFSPLPLRIVYLVVAAICLNNFNEVKVLYKPIVFEEITTSFRYLQQHGIKGNELYVHDLAKPAYIYYTGIHPRRAEWQDLQGGRLLNWDDDFEAIGRQMPPTSAILYSYEDPAEMDAQLAAIARSNTLTDHFHEPRAAVFIYRK